MVNQLKKMNLDLIKTKLPYSSPFLFVDELITVDENSIVGNFTFNENLDFYKGHFKDNPVTPGVILTETMAQIGLVALGIYLLGDHFTKDTVVAFTSADMQFLKPVYPNDKVTVISEKIFFRFGKLKCSVVMKNEADQEVCKGILAGMITNKL
jgi:3-hydroxyacyl-[acyl-carrier-protein] dehydratase